MKPGNIRKYIYLKIGTSRWWSTSWTSFSPRSRSESQLRDSHGLPPRLSKSTLAAQVLGSTQRLGRGIFIVHEKLESDESVTDFCNIIYFSWFSWSTVLLSGSDDASLRKFVYAFQMIQNWRVQKRLRSSENPDHGPVIKKATCEIDEKPDSTTSQHDLVSSTGDTDNKRKSNASKSSELTPVERQRTVLQDTSAHREHPWIWCHSHNEYSD